MHEFKKARFDKAFFVYFHEVFLLGRKFWYIIKVSRFQNEFIKSSFLPKYEPKIVRISAL